jgi:hypothetical protein
MSKRWLIMKKILAAVLLCLFVLSFGTAFAARQKYTGLIIDARELGVTPGKSPKIYDEKGIEIYGTINIDPDFVIERGIIQYSRTIGEAIRDELAGDNPIVVRAIARGPHPYKADVTISTEDALWVLKANLKSYFLQELRVVFVL